MDTTTWRLLAIFVAIQAPASQAAYNGKCGVPVSTTRIVGGVAVRAYRYPWFAALIPAGQRTYSVCAGTLVSPWYVMTAAHCFTEVDPDTPNEQKYIVAMGVTNQCRPSQNTRKDFGTSAVAVHEKYTESGKGFDIALIRLNKSADGYMPNCLPWNVPRTGGHGGSRRNKWWWARPAKRNDPSQLPDDGDRTGLISGFGTTMPGVSASAPCEMRHAQVPILSTEECVETQLPTDQASRPDILCAGKKLGGVDSCQGDSGGPLSTRRGNLYCIVGVVSYGYGCASPDLPGVYTRVASYKEWTEEKMDSLGSK